MPTGYTADIKDGISFQTFAMNCARAFGACIELRDEPGGGDLIPAKFEPSDYHQKAAEKARASLADLEAMTAFAVEQAAANDFDASETQRAVRLQEIAAQRASYESMLKKAQQWAPPTVEHQGLKDFMVDQIMKSIDFDCSTSYYATPSNRKTGEQWRAERKASLIRDVAYHTEKHEEEVKRAADRSAWVQSLRESLKDTP